MSTEPHPGEHIVAARRRKFLTQRELADAVGVSARSIREWEAGRSRPTLAHVAKLAQELELEQSAIDELAA